ncbi:nicotinate (nicotinamide) nucleotide adenylyltransferase [Candidatus Gracilibacteria bacterium]|nr:nicotinate (nicotinamide) nucleotide adenylyltransferase [Candidatus Gracilibacteria bacterium]
MPQRIGVYGGSFDPIHFGHLAIVEEARWALDLDEVLVVPAAQQPLKSSKVGASATQRLAMVQLACANNSRLRPSDIELRRPPPSYTVDTLAELRGSLPTTTELYFILGADALRDLKRWREPQRIVGLARIAVLARPGVTLDLAALETELPGLYKKLTQIDGPLLDISSTILRTRIAAGQPIRYQTPDAVCAYIAEQQLYV